MEVNTFIPLLPFLWRSIFIISKIIIIIWNCPSIFKWKSKLSLSTWIYILTGMCRCPSNKENLHISQFSGSEKVRTRGCMNLSYLKINLAHIVNGNQCLNTSDTSMWHFEFRFCEYFLYYSMCVCLSHMLFCMFLPGVTSRTCIKPHVMCPSYLRAHLNWHDMH